MARKDAAVVMGEWMVQLRGGAQQGLLLLLVKLSVQTGKSMVQVSISEVAAGLGMTRQAINGAACALEKKRFASRDPFKPGIWYVNPAIREDVTTDIGYRRMNEFHDLVRHLNRHRNNGGWQIVGSILGLPREEALMIDRWRHL